MSTTAGLSSKRQTCDVAKFLAALAVVNGHIFLFGNYDGILVRFMNLGACCVALFFFFRDTVLCSVIERRAMII